MDVLYKIPDVLGFIPTSTFCLLVAVCLVALILLRWRDHRVHRRANGASFCELPPDILLTIADHLPSNSKICLALTCKGLLSFLDPARDLRQCFELQHPRSSSALYRRCPRPGEKSIFDTPRWRLLRQLENWYFRCCSGCLKLHPVSEFEAPYLQIEAERRTCDVGGIFCGVVDLCPCRHLTFRDKEKLAAQLAKNHPRVSDGRIVYSGLSSWHQCSVTYGSASVRANQTPILEHDNSLVIDCQYTVTGNDLLREVPDVGFSCCPHRTVWHYFIDVLQFPGFTRDLGNDQMETEGCTNRNYHCGLCRTTYCYARWRLSLPSHKITTFSFHTYRSLGWVGRRADETWFFQADIAAEQRELCRNA